MLCWHVPFPSQLVHWGQAPRHRGPVPRNASDVPVRVPWTDQLEGLAGLLGSSLQVGTGPCVDDVSVTGDLLPTSCCCEGSVQTSTLLGPGPCRGDHVLYQQAENTESHCVVALGVPLWA